MDWLSLDNFGLGVAGLFDALNPATWVTGRAVLSEAVYEAQEGAPPAREDTAKALAGAGAKTGRQVGEWLKRALDALPWVLGAAAVVTVGVVAVVYLPKPR